MDGGFRGRERLRHLRIPCFRGAVLRRHRGESHILLTSTRLTWSAPPPTGRLGLKGDDSFDVALADIREVMCDDGKSAQLDTLHGRWRRIRHA